MKNSIKRYVPVICLVSGWVIGILMFYVARLLKIDMPRYGVTDPTFWSACSAIWAQLRLFIVICLLGFSMLSAAVPSALVFSRSALASFACALVYNSLLSEGGFSIRYAVFAVTSLLICVFLTSSARLARIFYTKVPHSSLDNVLDYLARQLFTMGFATAVLIAYFTVCAIL